MLGRNGVGKTSLLRAITGQHPVSSGSVAFEGDGLKRSAPYACAAQGIAIVPQGREIFPLLTVRENLETGFACLPRRQRRIPDEVFGLFPVLDEPTEGIQPSIIKDIGRALSYLRDTAGLTILLVEQYLDFCRELASDVYIMDRGEIVHHSPAEDLDREDIRRHLMV